MAFGRLFVIALLVVAGEGFRAIPLRTGAPIRAGTPRMSLEHWEGLLPGPDTTQPSSNTPSNLPKPQKLQKARRLTGREDMDDLDDVLADYSFHQDN